MPRNYSGRAEIADSECLSHSLIIAWLLLLSCFAGAAPDKIEAPMIPLLRIQIDENLIFSSLTDGHALSDSFILLLRETRSSAHPFLVKLSRKGKVIARYDRNGYGPGELSEVNRISVFGDRVAAVEFYHPILHLFDHNLRFIGDHRLMKSGDVVLFNSHYIGVKGVYYPSDAYAARGKAVLLALYDSLDFKFRQWAYPVSDVPAFVQYYGGVTATVGGFAAVYANDYQIKLFDEKMNSRGELLRQIPDHVAPYTPWKKNRSVVDAREADRWLAGWTVVNNIIFADGCYFIKYDRGQNRFMDIWDARGNAAALNLPCRHALAFSGDGHFWTVEREERNTTEPTYFLVQWRLAKKNVAQSP